MRTEETNNEYKQILISEGYTYNKHQEYEVLDMYIKEIIPNVMIQVEPLGACIVFSCKFRNATETIGMTFRLKGITKEDMLSVQQRILLTFNAFNQ